MVVLDEGKAGPSRILELRENALRGIEMILRREAPGLAAGPAADIVQICYCPREAKILIFAAVAEKRQGEAFNEAARIKQCGQGGYSP
jgi:hypothetical protein